MTALLAIGWQPELRGILITIIAVVTFCGSVYFLLSTNLGARLGFLVAFAALAGWMFLMGATWWTYGKGLLGPDASWAPVSGQTVLQTTDSPQRLGRARRADRSSTARRPDRNADCSHRPAFVDEGWTKLESVGAVVPAGGRAAGTLLEESGAMANGEFQVVNVFDKGGEARSAVAQRQGRLLGVPAQAALCRGRDRAADRATRGTRPRAGKARDRRDSSAPVRVHDPRPRCEAQACGLHHHRVARSCS